MSINKINPSKDSPTQEWL